MLAFCLTWIAAAAGYCLLVGTIDTVEGTAAILCGLLAAGWSLAVRRSTRTRFAYPPGGATAAGRAVAGLPSATLRIGALLLRSIASGRAGTTSDQLFLHGARRDPASAGRRAIGVLGRSLAPDSFVLRTPEQQDMIVLHRLGDVPDRRDPEWPV